MDANREQAERSCGETALLSSQNISVYLRFHLHTHDSTFKETQTSYLSFSVESNLDYLKSSGHSEYT